MEKQPMVILTGPTAVGKTNLSIELAKRINGAIISADSMQVYKYMDIGSAKIMPQEMQGIKHYLIDELLPSDEFNVFIFKKMAKNLLIEQKPLVQAYVIDQVRDKMIGNEAALGVIYSGEAIYTQKENPNLEYVIPKEGSNIWIDSWVIPKNAEHKENAEKFINFLCRPDIALMNFEYITYSTPNEAARELIEDESIRNSEIAFPDLSKYDNLETFQYLGTEADQVYGNLWNKVKSS